MRHTIWTVGHSAVLVPFRQSTANYPPWKYINGEEITTLFLFPDGLYHRMHQISHNRPKMDKNYRPQRPWTRRRGFDSNMILSKKVFYETKFRPRKWTKIFFREINCLKWRNASKSTAIKPVVNVSKIDQNQHFSQNFTKMPKTEILVKIANIWAISAKNIFLSKYNLTA